MNKLFQIRHCRLLCLLAMAMTVSGPPLRGKAMEADTLELDTYVITATRHETLLMESPVAISVLGNEEISRRPVATIADMLRDLPGVRVADNTLPGMQRLRIRGEDARRSLVLIDGQEISDHSTFGPPMLIDPSLIERIEVVRGPHSTLYGSRAAGGVINIITKKPSGSDYLEGSIGSAYSGATNGHRVNASLSGASGPWNYQVALNRSRDGDRKTPAGKLEDSSFESHGFMTRLGWTEGNHNLGLSFDRFNMSSEAPTSDELVDGFIISDFLLDLPQRDRQKIGFFYDGYQLFDGLDRLHIDTYLQTVDRQITQKIAGVVLPMTTPPSFYDFFNDDFDTIDTTGINLQADWTPAENHVLVSGLSFVKDDLDKSIDRTGFTRKGPVVSSADLLSKTRASIETSALFAQDTWSATEKLQVSAGVRHYSVDSRLKESNDPLLPPRSTRDSHTVGSASLVYAAKKELSLRLSWGQGYVFPTLLHLHTGSLFGQGNLTRPNPNLTPEESENFEAGLRYQTRIIKADIAVFSNRSENYIASVRASEVPELGWAPNENTYTNLDTARSRGVEAQVSIRMPDSNIEWYAQGSYLWRELEYATFTTDENGQPEWAGRAGLRYEKPIRKNLSWYLDAYGVAGGESALRTSRSTRFTGSWATFNLAAGISLKGEQEWWFGVEALNLTDENYRPSTDELIQPGRHLTLGARLKF